MQLLILILANVTKGNPELDTRGGLQLFGCLSAQDVLCQSKIVPGLSVIKLLLIVLHLNMHNW